MGSACCSAEATYTLPDTELKARLDEPSTNAYGDPIADDDSSDDGGKEQEEIKLSDAEKAQIEGDWMRSVQSSFNADLKRLLQFYGDKIDFLSIVFDNKDNTLQTAVRTGNTKLCKLMIMMGIDVRFCVYDNF